MKNFINSTPYCSRIAIALLQPVHRFFNTTLLLCVVFVTGLLLTGCKKEAANALTSEMQSMKSAVTLTDKNVLLDYTGLSKQTAWELQQARAATAKYQDIKNALKDGYEDIHVAAQNMGYHYMNTTLVDATFDIRNPEILVYNKDAKGNYYLVAVEYAVPLSQPRPQGFTGTSDVWDDASGFPFWLLHAWVWAYNPAGVFNPTNPLVHLH